MSDSHMKQDIAHYFGDAVADDEDLRTECIKMCKTYNLTPEALSWKWEAFVYGESHLITVLTIDKARELRSSLQRGVEEEARKRNVVAQSRMARNMFAGRKQPFASAPSARINSTPVTVKAEAGNTVIPGSSRVTFRGPADDEASRKKRKYRFMYEKISERSEALDDHTDNFSTLVQQHYNITEIGDPSASTENEIIVVGRIVHEAGASSSTTVKLNEASLVLETSRMGGSGARVPLQLSDKFTIQPPSESGLNLFPGAIVACRGKNGGGGFFVVSEVLTLPPLQSSSVVRVKSESGRSQNFSAEIACGPFTADQDLKFKPWHSFLVACKSARPDVVILIGPFIDIEHPLLASGAIDNTPSDIFRSQFIETLRSEFLDACPGSIAIFIPSVRDSVNSHCVFPQAEFSSELASGDSRIHFAPNPAKFSLNDVTFSATSVDVLFHLQKERFTKRSTAAHTETDNMAQLCGTILQQRSLYPIFPIPIDVTREVNLDVSHAYSKDFGIDLAVGPEADCAPDVLLLPSRLKQFSKVVNETHAINPNFLAKGAYVSLQFTGAAPDGSVKDSIKIDLRKLE